MGGDQRWEGARVVIRGGGDLGSGAAARLHRAGFPVIILELPQPIFVRRTVCFGDAVYAGVRTVEGIRAQAVATSADAAAVTASGAIAVLVDPDGSALSALDPAVVVDARMEKRNLGTRMADALCVIALGPGFTAGEDCHAVVETNRGHYLGRVYWEGTAEPDTGEPGVMGGHSHSRVLRAPAAGQVAPVVQIGDAIAAGSLIATVDGVPVSAAFAGLLRGLIHPSVNVTPGMKIGDLDPRANRDYCFTFSEKALAVGGGVLEAVMASAAVRGRLLAGERS